MPNAKHITNTNSGHEIHKEQPQLVVDSIREVVDAVRRGSRADGALMAALSREDGNERGARRSPSALGEADVTACPLLSLSLADILELWRVFIFLLD